MRIILKRLLLIGLTILATSGAALADDLKLDPPATTSPTTAGVAVGTRTPEAPCAAASTERAREVADQAWQDGSYQLAGECYLAAGKPVMADRAFVKALAPQAALTSRRLVENQEASKTQIRQWKQAIQALQPAH